MAPMAPMWHQGKLNSTEEAMETLDNTRARERRLQRWLLAGLGMLLVGIGAVGVFLPGLPTTIFLLGASWCFARSCPWLEERLIRVPLFRPFLGFLDNGATMPRRTVVTTLVIMWIAITASVVTLNLGAGMRPVMSGFIIALGLVGTVFFAENGPQSTPEDRNPATARDEDLKLDQPAAGVASEEVIDKAVMDSPRPLQPLFPQRRGLGCVNVTLI